MRRTLAFLFFASCCVLITLYYRSATLGASLLRTQLNDSGFSNVEVILSRPNLYGVGASRIYASYPLPNGKLVIGFKNLNVSYDWNLIISGGKFKFEKIHADLLELNFFQDRERSSKEEKGNEPLLELPDLPFEKLEIETLKISSKTVYTIINGFLLKQSKDKELTASGEIVAKSQNLALLEEIGASDFEVRAKLQSGIVDTSSRLTNDVLGLGADLKIDLAHKTATYKVSAKPKAGKSLLKFLAANKSELINKPLTFFDPSHLELIGKFEQENIDASFKIATKTSDFNGNIEYNSSNQNLIGKIKLSALKVTELNQLYHLFAGPHARQLKDAKGQLDAQLNFQKSGENASASVAIALKDVSGRIDKWRIENLNLKGTLFYQNSKIYSDKPFRIEIDKLLSSIPITDIAVELSLPRTKVSSLPAAVKFQSQLIRAKLFDGEFSSNKFQYEINKPLNLELDAKGIDLEAILKLYPNETVSATGIVDLSVPLRIDSRGVTVKNGKLNARSPGGSISYTAIGGDKTSNTNTLNTALKALKDFRYKTLNSSVEYAENGELTLATEMTGTSPGVDKNRQVNLNLTISENIPALLHSLSLSKDLSEQINSSYKGELR